MRFSLRTLLVLLVVGPPLIAAAKVAIEQAVASLHPPKPATSPLIYPVTPRIVILEEEEEELL
jgi:hypothetical protein